jgi:DNA replication protein DnaC
MMTNDTLRKMNELKLFGMAHAFTTQVESASAAHLSFEERISLMIDHEVTYRDDRRLQHLLSSAKLREQACVEDIDYEARRGQDRATMASLSLCNWVRHGVDVIVTGATGLGKTWIACALGNQACRHGMTVKFERVPTLLEDLAVAHAERPFRKRLTALSKLDLLILDDLGINTLTADRRSDLLEVIQCRTGDRSTIVTSQLPVKRWHDYLGDGNPTVADAILDRIVSDAHHADGAEYQLPQASTSTVTRAAVLAELADAQAKGLLQSGERDWPQIAFTSQRTRAEVRAETLQAIASGELRFLNEEPQSAFGTFVPKRKASNTLITVAAK